MKRVIFSAVFLFAISQSVQGKLIIYDSGPGLVYDTVTNVTWLMNANYVETTGYDDQLYGSNTGGKLTWYDAEEWVSNLSIYDTTNNIVWSDFRLPTYDGTYGSNYYGVYEGSEFYNLFYSVLGNTDDNTEGMENQGPFINIAEQGYWTGVTHPENKYYANIYVMNWGYHTFNNKLNLRYVWPVMDGDVAGQAGLKPLIIHTPAPSAVVLVCLGGGLTGWLRRRRII
ncbi:MAG: DUF1566 domain-containing protein [Sedimentisphaerales bacterium]|nr:DUF1566 domain-containing protein [Sedimentisphaerales bacterium]